MATRNGIVTGIITGALIGTALGLMFAPKTGKETRVIVGERTSAIKTKAGDYITVIRNKMKRDEEVESLNGASYSDEITL